MKNKNIFMIIGLVLALFIFGCQGEKTTPTKTEDGVYPKGTVIIYGHGQPQYLEQYFDAWLERNRDIAPEVEIDVVQTEGAADSREKITMTYLAGAYEDLPDAVYLDPVNLTDLAMGDILKDETELMNSVKDKIVDGSINDAMINGKVYGLTDSVRPQVLFYNKEIFDKYDIDPARMETMEGYILVGKELKEKSNGKVYLSYIDPTWKTWRYWGRRGLMPQANARIWDEEGNVIIGSDEGTKLALYALDEMNSNGLLIKTEIMGPALYDYMREGKVATFYMGAFWDEFIRKNVSETSGKWRVMPAPYFKEVGTVGAPVASYLAVVNKADGKYSGLVEKLWYDFQFDNQPRIEWVNDMVEQNAPYANPISLEMLEDLFWKEPAEFYGETSFREMESMALKNSSKNLVITPQDAQADEIITIELEKYIAGDQTIDEAIINMEKNLKNKIGQAEIN